MNVFDRNVSAFALAMGPIFCVVLQIRNPAREGELSFIISPFHLLKTSSLLRPAPAPFITRWKT
jgi:hypothetical protein